MSYESVRDLALRMIAAKGRAITFTRPAEGFDPITQAGNQPAPTYVLRGIGFPLSAGKAAYVFGAGAATVTKQRLQVTVALKNSTNRPAIGDRFSWGGVPLRIATDPEVLDPDGSGNPITASFIAEAG